MKTLKISLLGALGLGAAVLCTASAFSADQQPAGRPPQRQGQAAGQRQQEFMKKMVEELKLTPDQQKKIQENQKAQAEKLAKLRQDTTLSQEDRRTKMRTIREESDKGMKEILTKEQFEKWQKLRQEEARRARERGAGQGGGRQRGTGTAQ
jgi:Spy/CpxP family protein refolding chaperone